MTWQNICLFYFHFITQSSFNIDWPTKQIDDQMYFLCMRLQINVLMLIEYTSKKHLLNSILPSSYIKANCELWPVI